MQALMLGILRDIEGAKRLENNSYMVLIWAMGKPNSYNHMLFETLT